MSSNYPIRMAIGTKTLKLANFRSAEMEIKERKSIGLLPQEKTYVAVDKNTCETRIY